MGRCQILTVKERKNSDKTAFLFAGQGAQYLGMARDLYATYPIVKETFDTASQILGYDLRELIDS